MNIAPVGCAWTVNQSLAAGHTILPVSQGIAPSGPAWLSFYMICASAPSPPPFFYVSCIDIQTNAAPRLITAFDVYMRPAQVNGSRFGMHFMGILPVNPYNMDIYFYNTPPAGNTLLSITAISTAGII